MKKYPRKRRYYRRTSLGRYYPKPNSKNPPRELTEEEKKALDEAGRRYREANEPRRAWEPWLDGPYYPGYAPRHRFFPRGSW